MGIGFGWEVVIEMKHSLMLAFLVLLVTTIIPLPAGAQATYPKMEAVTPETGRVGDVLTVEGQNLGNTTVESLYLTDGQTDWKTEIVEQSATSIRFKIPATAKPGRFSLMVLTAGETKTLIEQPIKVTVES